MYVLYVSLLNTLWAQSRPDMPSVTVKAHHLVKSANLPARLVFVKQHDSKVQQGFPDPLKGKR